MYLTQSFNKSFIFILYVLYQLTDFWAVSQRPHEMSNLQLYIFFWENGPKKLCCSKLLVSLENIELKIGSSDFIGSVLKGIVYPKMNLYAFISSVEQQRKQNKNDLKNLTQL